MWRREKEIERKEEKREDCMEKGGLKRRERTICRKGWTDTDDRTKWRRGRAVLRKGRWMDVRKVRMKKVTNGGETRRMRWIEGNFY